MADTQNNRVLIWNTIPTKNNQPADLVLGAPNFTTVPERRIRPPMRVSRVASTDADADFRHQRRDCTCS